ncbi:MAG: 3'-5' exoribonuclease YhaM family protein [Candidatus Acidiferrales bacterium]
MKPQFVSHLTEGQIVSSHFLVREKEIRTSARTGSSWLQLELADRTGSISAKMWDNFSALASAFERGDVVLIRGRVKMYNGQKELTLEQIVPAAERDYDLADFLPHTKHDVEEMYARLRAAISAMKSPWLKQLLASVVEDPAIVPRLKRAPAAMNMHHAYLGGLLEHIVSMIGLSSAIAAHYPELDADLLLTGVVLHDIGKIDELCYEREIGYTDTGRLLGHITISAALAREKIKAIAGFPAPLAVLVEHLILSHHGSLEFGSPSLPQTREAVALHFMDDMDSKMASMRASLELAPDAAEADVWTERNASLRRALLRVDQFLLEGAASTSRGEEPAKASPVAAPRPSSATAGRKG